MRRILSATACNLDVNILAASLPLLEESRIEAIEWSFDSLFKVKEIPPWFLELLTVYGNEKRLIGHGVFFSLFSGKWTKEQQKWLQHLRRTCAIFHFDHITEHFGFMTGKDFHQGAPLSIPYSKVTLEIGRDRLKRMYAACECPVGLENLAFSYSLEEVKRHGTFLEELLEPVNGFIILDLHNLYCHLHNFDISFEELIVLYPLDRVREIHISGGSWDGSLIEPGRRVRRDTHDDTVPEEVFRILELAIDRCPNLKYVVLEQLGNALETYESKKGFYDDFKKMQGIVQKKNQQQALGPVNNFLPLRFSLNKKATENEQLYRQQRELSVILETAGSYTNAMEQLKTSSLSHSEWQVETWKPYMLEAAINIAQKWKKGWE
jgi:uncharacterized protein (UPF0276 family)